MRSSLLLVLGLVACGDVASVDPDAPPAVPDTPVDVPVDAPLGVLGIALDQTTRTAPRAIGIEIDVTLSRDRVDGDVVITAGGLPDGITAEPLTIAGGATTGTLVLWIASDATAPTGAISIIATAATTETASAPLTLALDDAHPAFDLTWDLSAPERTSRALYATPGWTVEPRSFVLARESYDPMLVVTWIGLDAAVTSVPITVTDTGQVTTTLGVSATATPNTSSAWLVFSDGLLRQQLAASVTVIAAPALDPTVGTNGRLTIDAGRAVAADLDSAGRVLAAHRSNGALTVQRYTATGLLDESWSAPTISDLSPSDLLVGGADTMFVLGVFDQRVRIARLLTDGSLDPSFAGDGVHDVPSLATEYGTALRTRGNKLVYAGALGGEAHVTRLTSEGGVDATFGTNGRAIFGAGTFNDFLFDATGKIVAVGRKNDADAGDPAMLVRFNTDGTLDTTFGSGGSVTIDQSATLTTLDSIAELANGDLVAGGYYIDEHNTDRGLVVRVSPTGTPVSTFGTNGSVTLGMAEDHLEFFRVNKVRATAAGITVYGDREETYGTTSFVVAARLDDAGQLVSTFGTGGYTWLLGGVGPEFLSAIRSTAAGTWVFAYDGNATTLMRLVTP